MRWRSYRVKGTRGNLVQRGAVGRIPALWKNASSRRPHAKHAAFTDAPASRHSPQHPRHPPLPPPIMTASYFVRTPYWTSNHTSTDSYWRQRTYGAGLLDGYTMIHAACHAGNVPGLTCSKNATSLEVQFVMLASSLNSN